jgi:hypothetical protein
MSTALMGIYNAFSPSIKYDLLQTATLANGVLKILCALKSDARHLKGGVLRMEKKRILRRNREPSFFGNIF